MENEEQINKILNKLINHKLTLKEARLKILGVFNVPIVDKKQPEVVYKEKKPIIPKPELLA